MLNNLGIPDINSIRPSDTYLRCLNLAKVPGLGKSFSVLVWLTFWTGWVLLVGGCPVPWRFNSLPSFHRARRQSWPSLPSQGEMARTNISKHSHMSSGEPLLESHGLDSATPLLKDHSTGVIFDFVCCIHSLFHNTVRKALPQLSSYDERNWGITRFKNFAVSQKSSARTIWDSHPGWDVLKTHTRGASFPKYHLSSDACEVDNSLLKT